jgi:hypothetical protein
MSTVPLSSGRSQVAYVTSDLEAGTRQLAAIYGIDRLRLEDDVPSARGMPEMFMGLAS